MPTCLPHLPAFTSEDRRLTPELTPRAMRIGRILTESWHVPKIHFIDRVDRRNHTGNIHFSYTSINYNRSTCEGFDNLPAEALTPAENALRQMYKANAPA